jgi:hypothetical protein
MLIVVHLQFFAINVRKNKHLLTKKYLLMDPKSYDR